MLLASSYYGKRFVALSALLLTPTTVADIGNESEYRDRVLVDRLQDCPVGFEPYEVDFSVDIDGNRIEAGQELTVQLPLGITVSRDDTADNGGSPAWVYDSASSDGNVLIVDQKSTTTSSRQYRKEKLYFEFDQPRMIRSVQLADTQLESKILVDLGGAKQTEVLVPPVVSAGATVDVVLNVASGDLLKIFLFDAAAVVKLSLCKELPTQSTTCAFLDTIESVEDKAGSLRENLAAELDDVSPIFNLPDDFDYDNILDFLIDKLETQCVEDNQVLLPTVIRVEEDESVADIGGDLDTCANLEVVNTDSMAFGFENDFMGLCAAINPCQHVYALSQAGILPEISIAKIFTFEILAAAFSLDRHGLLLESGNAMWNGRRDAAILRVPGHVYLMGTGSVGIRVSNNIKAEVIVTGQVIIDADPKEDGFFSPLGEASNKDGDPSVEIVDTSTAELPSIDFAMLISASQTFVLTLKTGGEEFEMDLGGLIENKKDLYITVDNLFIEVRYASGVEIDLAVLCELSHFLKPLCILFGDETGIMGRVNAFFNTNGDFGLMLSVEATFEVHINTGNEEIDDTLKDIFGLDDVSFEGAAEISMDYTDDVLELCLKLNGGSGFDECLSFCKEDSQCPDDKFCNPILGMCRPRRNNGFFPCIKDTQCLSDRCTDVTRTCAAKLGDGDSCLSGKACVSGHCSLGICGSPCGSQGCSSSEFCNSAYTPDFCRPMRENGFGLCGSDAQCKSGRCTDVTRICAAKLDNGDSCLSGKACVSGHCSLGICGSPCSQGCSTSEFCNSAYTPDFCRPKRDNGFHPCGSDAQCKSGRCTDTTRICKAKLGGGATCSSGKACVSGKCVWFSCTNP